MSTFCILITATIDPKGMSFTRRKNPKLRENDYIVALERLLSVCQYPVVFYENSGSDTSRIEAVFKKFPQVPYEIIEYPDGQNFPRHLGKGYGETLAIRNAINNSKLILDSKYVVKFTGRYIIENLKDILGDLEKEGDFMIASTFDRNITYTWSLFFVAKISFLEKYLLPLQDKINDSERKSMEAVLYDAITMAMADGEQCIPIRRTAILTGISGTWNAKVNPIDHYKVKMSVAKVIIFMRKYTKAIIRRIKIISGKIKQ